MKITIFGLFVSIIGLPALGQNLETTKLQQSIKEHPQQDTTRVNLLNTLAIDQSLQPDEIEKLSTEALTISRKTDYAIGEGYALLNLSTAKLKQGNRQQAVLFIQQADSIANKTGDQELIANVLLGMGNANMYGANNRQALAYKKKAEEIALKTGNKKLTSICQREIGVIYGSSFNDYPKAIEYTLKSVRSAEEAGCLSCLAKGWFNLGTSYSLVGDQDNALLYFKKAADANKQLGDKVLEVKLNNNIGGYYRLMGKYPEAIQFYNKSLAATKEPYAITMAESNLADVYTSTDSLALAYKYAFSSLATAKQIDDQESMAWIYSILSCLYLKKKMVDSAIYSSRQGLAIAKQTGTLNYMRDNAEALANAYAFKKDFENAYHYHLLYFNYHDSILNSEISKKIALLQYSSDLAKKQAQITALDQQKRVQQNFLISALIVLMLIIIIAVVLLRANRLLQKQKLEIAHQRDQTNKALAELQQTQKQIIQSEKMASLGQLAAGIAHEIQNPLNFVNNFSEVSSEMLDEMKEELATGNEQQASEIADDVKQNLEKIIHHGKRAEAIVKGMLQHSRVSTGQKELTDVNALADEYLRLSYHGLRAKDKSFNAILQTGFDASIEKINIIPQDIGRVLLNLFNNAFYTVHQKQNMTGLNHYEPLVSVHTKKVNGKVEIHIKDNGVGIPQKVVDKIFQPFFTTKAAGQGTCLGLSLSYDIVKAHGGEIKVETKEGEGAEFVIQLPLDKK